MRLCQHTGKVLGGETGLRHCRLFLLRIQVAMERQYLLLQQEMAEEAAGYTVV